MLAPVQVDVRAFDRKSLGDCDATPTADSSTAQQVQADPTEDLKCVLRVVFMAVSWPSFI
jgi:hypothetical protein